jgi:enoyl-CoA hydratase
MSTFQLSREGAVAVLTHDDGKANTFTRPQFDELFERLDDVQRSDATALLYRGRTGYFSAGLNLKILPTLKDTEWAPLLSAFGECVLRLFTFPKPVVAEVTGHAIGAGAMLAYAADVRIFQKGAFKFGLNEVPNGLPVPGYGVEVARAALPWASQIDLIVHGRMIDPDEALRLRVAEQVVDDAHGAALERATALAGLPTDPYAVTKLNLRGSAAESARARITAETEQFIQAMSGRR